MILVSCMGLLGLALFSARGGAVLVLAVVTAGLQAFRVASVNPVYVIRDE